MKKKIKTKSLSELKNTFSVIDERTKKLENDVNALVKFIKELKVMQSNFEALNKYYLGDWQADVDALEKHENVGQFYSTNQDSIWNATAEWYELKMKLVKTLVKDL